MYRGGVRAYASARHWTVQRQMIDAGTDRMAEDGQSFQPGVVPSGGVVAVAEELTLRPLRLCGVGRRDKCLWQSQTASRSLGIKGECFSCAAIQTKMLMHADIVQAKMGAEAVRSFNWYDDSLVHLPPAVPRRHL